MPIFPVFPHNIRKNTSKSFLKKSIDRKKFSSSNVVSYAKTIQKNAWASLLQFAGVTMPHLPHVSRRLNPQARDFHNICFTLCLAALCIVSFSIICCQLLSGMQKGTVYRSSKESTHSQNQNRPKSQNTSPNFGYVVQKC